MTDMIWKNWWVVRWGKRLAHIEADDADDAIHGSTNALRGMGDWMEDPGELSAFPYVEFRNHTRPREFTRGVIDRKLRSERHSRRRSGKIVHEPSHRNHPRYRLVAHASVKPMGKSISNGF